MRCLLSHMPGEHIHPHLEIIIEGAPVTIPADIGLTPTRHFNPHTHDTAGILHVGEGPLSGIDPPGSPVRFTTLDDFFDVWRTTGTVGTPQNNPNAIFNDHQILNRVEDATHMVRMTVNGMPNTEFENYAPHDGDQVAISFETITNHAPTANNQNVNVSLNTAKSITLTGDDGDPDVVQTLSFRVQSLPTNGTLRDSNGNLVVVGATLPSANLTYTPTAAFAGGDTVTFQVMDSGGGQDASTTATVTIAVATNLRPTVNAQNVTASLNTAKTITLTGDDGDPDVSQTLTFQVQTLPTNGTLRDSNGAVVVANTNLPSATVTYTPNLNFAGNDSLVFIAKDGGGTDNGGQDTSLPATVSILVPANHAPLADSQTVTVQPGAARMITLTANDGDGDVVQTLSFRVQTLPTNGTLTDSNGIAVTSGTNLPSAIVTYTAAASTTSTDLFTFVAVDNGGTTGGGHDTSTAATVTLRRPSNGQSAEHPSLQNGVLTIPGTPDDDTVEVAMNGTDIEVTVNGGTPMTFAESDVDMMKIRGHAGEDEITVDTDVAVFARIRGGRGDDTITGSDTESTLRGGRGNDDITGGDGDDEIHGGHGTDTIDAGDGDNKVWGGDGDDDVTTGDGDDHIRGRRGNDTVDAGDGDNDVHGGQGDDDLTTGDGDDTVRGGSGENIVDAGAGNNDLQNTDDGDDHDHAANQAIAALIEERQSDSDQNNVVASENVTTENDVALSRRRQNVDAIDSVLEDAATGPGLTTDLQGLV